MNVKSIIKKNKLLFLVVITYITIFIIAPDKAARSVENSVYYLIEMLQVLPVIFLFTVVIEAIVPKEMIIRGFGEKSGFRGNLLALLLGSISAGPIYAAFPVSKTLLGKGASISNIVIILSTWAVIKVPMLANEVKFLGMDFMGVRWVLTVTAIFLMAYITGLIIKKKDLPANKTEVMSLEINEEYCIGCGICIKLCPDYYEMDDNKVVVKKMPEGEKAMSAIQESIDKCPSNAIILNRKGKVS